MDYNKRYDEWMSHLSEDDPLKTELSKIKDKYDFTNPNLKKKEYEESPLASVLNNCGVVSQQYGVIRPYYVCRVGIPGLL